MGRLPEVASALPFRDLHKGVLDDIVPDSVLVPSRHKVHSLRPFFVLHYLAVLLSAIATFISQL